MDTQKTFPFSDFALKGDFTRADILTALKICPYTSYRIGAETGITQASIQNYRTGRSRPSVQIARSLASYLRLYEYVTQHKDEMDYLEFLEKYGVNPLVEPKPVTIGYVDGYTPKTTKEEGDTMEQPGLHADVVLGRERQEYEEALDAVHEQIDALHALVLAQKKTIDNYKREIERLSEKLKERF